MSVFEDEIDYDTEEFPYPKQVTRSAFLHDLQIDESDPSKSLQNLKSHTFDVDKFLHDNYRYTLLEDLQKELNVLLTDLEKDLFDLVNDDYFEFIKLGKSLDGGEGLVDSLRVDVGKYRKKVADENRKLQESQGFVQRSVANLDKLSELKKHAQRMLLLDTLIQKFETLLNQTKSTTHIQILKQLTSLYLSLHQLLTTLTQYQFVKNKAEHITVLRYEFTGILDEYLRNIRPGKTPHEDITDILGIYGIIGDQGKAVDILKDVYSGFKESSSSST